MEEQIKGLIQKGCTLNDIYRSLSVTKKLVNDVLKSMDYHTLAACGWNAPRRIMETVLFSQHRKYSYQRGICIGPEPFDYVVFEDAEPVLAIVVLGPEFLESDGLPVYGDDIYNANIRQLLQKAELCNAAKIPLLQFSILELFGNPFLTNNVRAALRDYEYADKHNKDSREDYFDIFSLYMCGSDNYKEIKSASLCGCYNCGAVVHPDEITRFNQDDSGACPVCGGWSIIADSQGFSIDAAFMEHLRLLSQE